MSENKNDTPQINLDLYYFMMALNDVDLARVITIQDDDNLPEPSDIKLVKRLNNLSDKEIPESDKLIDTLHEALDKSYKILTKVVKEHRDVFINSPVREIFDIDSLLDVLDKEDAKDGDVKE